MHLLVSVNIQLKVDVSIMSSPFIPLIKNPFLRDSQIHLDVTPLVAAFREDLLDSMLTGHVAVTQQMLKGMQLLHDEVGRSCKVVSKKVFP